MSVQAEQRITSFGRGQIKCGPGQTFVLSRGMDVGNLNDAVSEIAPDAKRQIFLHDNDAGGVDIHMRFDGKPAPDKWWLIDRGEGEIHG